MLITTTLLLLPVTQSLACATNSRSGTAELENPVNVMPSPYRRIVAPVQVTTVQAVKAPAQTQHCHSKAVDDMATIAGEVGKPKPSSCQCDHHCCQYSMTNAAVGIYQAVIGGVKSTSVIPTLNTLKPDFLSFPLNPPPIIS